MVVSKRGYGLLVGKIILEGDIELFYRNGVFKRHILVNDILIIIQWGGHGMFSIKDKVVVITGCATGIGKATAHRFSEAGARLILADIKDASELANEVDGKFVKTDVRQESEVKNLMEAAVDTYGKLNVVINNAGILRIVEVKDITEEVLDEVKPDLILVNYGDDTHQDHRILRQQ